MPYDYYRILNSFSNKFLPGVLTQYGLNSDVLRWVSKDPEDSPSNHPPTPDDLYGGIENAGGPNTELRVVGKTKILFDSIVDTGFFTEPLITVLRDSEQIFPIRTMYDLLTGDVLDISIIDYVVRKVRMRVVGVGLGVENVREKWKYYITLA